MTYSTHAIGSHPLPASPHGLKSCAKTIKTSSPSAARRPCNVRTQATAIQHREHHRQAGQAYRCRQRLRGHRAPALCDIRRRAEALHDESDRTRTRHRTKISRRSPYRTIEDRPPHAPQLLHPQRKLRDQRRAGRSRLQLGKAPRLAAGALARHVADARRDGPHDAIELIAGATHPPSLTKSHGTGHYPWFRRIGELYDDPQPATHAASSMMTMPPSTACSHPSWQTLARRPPPAAVPTSLSGM